MNATNPDLTNLDPEPGCPDSYRTAESATQRLIIAIFHSRTPHAAAVALQGPSAAAVLQEHVNLDLSTIFFGNFVKAEIAGAPSFITRTGCAGGGSGVKSRVGVALMS